MEIIRICIRRADGRLNQFSNLHIASEGEIITHLAATVHGVERVTKLTQTGHVHCYYDVNSPSKETCSLEEVCSRVLSKCRGIRPVWPDGPDTLQSRETAGRFN